MAKYKQRDIVVLKEYPKLPDGTDNEDHPILIISNDSSNSYESFYTGLMISATEHVDRFSFPLDKSQTNSPMRKPGSQIRLRIVISFREEDVSGKKNELTKNAFPHVRQRFVETVLS